MYSYRRRAHIGIRLPQLLPQIGIGDWSVYGFLFRHGVPTRAPRGRSGPVLDIFISAARGGTVCVRLTPECDNSVLHIELDGLPYNINNLRKRDNEHARRSSSTPPAARGRTHDRRTVCTSLLSARRAQPASAGKRFVAPRCPICCTSQTLDLLGVLLARVLFGADLLGHLVRVRSRVRVRLGLGLGFNPNLVPTLTLGHLSIGGRLRPKQGRPP